MSKEAKSGRAGLRFFLQFVPELWDAESVERVYALTLDAVQEIFNPDRAFWRFPSPRTWHPMRRRFNEAGCMI